MRAQKGFDLMETFACTQSHDQILLALYHCCEKIVGYAFLLEPAVNGFIIIYLLIFDNGCEALRKGNKSAERHPRESIVIIRFFDFVMSFLFAKTPDFFETDR